MQHPRTKRALAAILGLGLAAASISPALAQSSDKAPAATEQGGQAAAEYSENDLKAFAVAALEVRRIRESFTPKVEAAETPEQRQEISKEATDQMVKAVEKHGLTAQKYNNIYADSQSNEQLAERVNQHLREAQ